MPCNCGGKNKAAKQAAALQAQQTAEADRQRVQAERQSIAAGRIAARESRRATVGK